MTITGEDIVNFIDKLIDKCIMLICIVLALMCLYAMYDSYMIFYHANDSSIQKYKPTTTEEMQALVETMPDSTAWITIDDTNIDYPVMQGITNNDYLNTDPYGNYSLSGSIFLDSRNASDFSDPYSLIYGHHMDHGSMFGALDDYLSRDFFMAHRTGTLLVKNHEYQIDLFAVVETDAGVDTVFNPVSGEDIRTYIYEHAKYYEPHAEGKLIGLSTCATAGSTTRLVVFGILK